MIERKRVVAIQIPKYFPGIAVFEWNNDYFIEMLLFSPQQTKADPLAEANFEEPDNLGIVLPALELRREDR